MMEYTVLAHSNVSGGPSYWFAETDEPWLEIVFSVPIAGIWLAICWDVGIFEPVCRPVVRCENSDKETLHEIILAGAPYGRGRHIVYIPPLTVRLLMSPVNRAGSFRFRLNTVQYRTLLSVYMSGFRQSFRTALAAYGSLLIGRTLDARELLHLAANSTSTKRYLSWSLHRKRVYDVDFDGSPVREKPHIRFLIPSDTEGSSVKGSLIESSLKSAAGADILAFRDEPIDVLTLHLKDDDLIACVPAATYVHPFALDVIRSAALREPDMQLFYGDSDYTDDSQPVIRPSFDRLLLQRRDYIGESAIWRVGAARKILMGKDIKITHPLPMPDEAKMGRSLSKFLFKLPGRPHEICDNSSKARSDTVLFSDNIQTAILIPTRDRLSLLKPCVDSILEKTLGAYRIVILDNDSREPETLAYLSRIKRNPQVTVLHIAGAFNFSAICNEGARQTHADVLIFLNNDTLVIHGNWLLRLAQEAMQPTIGAVGVKLLYPAGTVQHCGLIVGLFGGAGHFEAGANRHSLGYFRRADVPHQLSAVTGACLGIARETYMMIDGFDADNLPVDLNDVDLCLRLEAKGFTNILLGDCCLYHLESASRGLYPSKTGEYLRERAYFSRVWLKKKRADASFSPLLSLYSQQPKLG